MSVSWVDHGSLRVISIIFKIGFCSKFRLVCLYLYLDLCVFTCVAYGDSASIPAELGE